MLNRDESIAIIERALQLSDADETEVVLGGGRAALTRFAANVIHQNVDETRPMLRIRGAWSRSGAVRQGVATAQTLDEAAIVDAVARARAAAQVAPVESGWVGLTAPGFYESNPTAAPTAFDVRTAEAGPVSRANDIARVVLRCRREAGMTTSGYLRHTDGAFGEYGEPSVLAVGNSHGVRLHHRGTVADFSATVFTERGGSAWVSATSSHRDGIDVDTLAERAIERARRCEQRRQLEPGRYRVLLEPAAVAALLHFALAAFSRRAIHEARSYLSDRLGDRVASPLLTLRCDPQDPVLAPRPFDAEGVPTRAITLIEAGFAREVAVGRFDGEPERDANGYSRLQPSEADAAPWYATLSGGAGSVDDLAARHGDVPLVSRLWYNRLVNARQVRVTGMTRDGFFSRRGGALSDALVDMRYNVGVFDVLAAVVDASEPVRVGDLAVPALVVDAFAFTAATAS